MKRKVYVKAEINVVKAELPNNLLAGSGLTVTGTIDGSSTFDYGGSSSNSEDDGTGHHSADAKCGLFNENK